MLLSHVTLARSMLVQSARIPYSVHARPIHARSVHAANTAAVAKTNGSVDDSSGDNGGGNGGGGDSRAAGVGQGRREPGHGRGGERKGPTEVRNV